MGAFRDARQLQTILDALFQRVAARPGIAERLLAGGFVLRFRYTAPSASVTVDLRGDELRWELGESSLKPDLELIQAADVAHAFWLGKLNVPLAIASRKVVSRGDISKALALLPAVRPVFPLYREVLAEHGLAAAPERAVGKTTLRGRLERHVRDLRARLARLARSRPSTQVDDRPAPPMMQLVDAIDQAPPELRASTLPSDRAELEQCMLERMLLIRRFEQKLADAYASGEVPTEAIHLSIGQEAVAVGVCFALRPSDHMATTHRGHGHMLAKGAPADRMMAEIMAKATGLCGGKGGSMHVTDAAVGAIGANGIVGASPLLAAGAGVSIRRRGSDDVAVAFFGDGATNQGMFHEAMNYAAVFELPVLFVVENNQYGEFTALAKHTKVDKLEDRALAYNMPARTVDGNDVWAVYEATTEAVIRARRGGGPSLLVCETYRWHGHMEGESVPYRSKAEIAAWKERCPIRAWRRTLESRGVSADAFARVDERVERATAHAWTFARESPEPAVEALAKDVFAPEPRALYQASPASTKGREITCSQAIREALAEEIERDERVYLAGEDVTGGGYFAVTKGLSERFGTERIVDTPISEYAIVGSAVGAAMTGSRPVVEILFADFLTTCADPIVNNAAKLRYMSGGQYRLPLVVRAPGGAGLGMAAQHSQSLEAWLTGIPGLIVVAPGTAADAKGLLKAAIRSENPVVFFENKLLYAATGVVPGGDHLVPIGKAAVQRAGRDLTLVSVGASLLTALAAAELLAAEGVDVEVIDPRTLAPLDVPTIVRSVAKTGRLVTVEEAPITHGFGGEIVARVCERAFSTLRAAPRRVAAVDVPIPYNGALERTALPSVDRLAGAIRATLQA